jgi:TonB family protein
MTTTVCPNPVSTTATRPIPQPAADSQCERSPTGSAHYESPPRSRTFIAIATLLSLSIHTGIFFGRIPRTAAPTKPQEERSIALTFTMPQLRELEEPETGPRDEIDTKPDLGVPTPMQADLPQIPLPTDFVQTIDFSSLIERPEINLSKIWTVPESIRRGGKTSGGPGNIFNLSDLDRVPEPVMQAVPIYPQSMKAAGVSARVVVDFIVDTGGSVLNAVVLETTHPGFDAAAVTGVQKWKFRPGVREGRKVNTRMRVPIIFSLTDALGTPPS